jgi:hypothetical protein
MTDDLYSLENDLRQVAIDTRTSYARQLDELGLEAKIGFRKRFQGGAVNAEIQVTFMRNGDLVDALEGLVIKASAPAVSNEELASWLHEGMRDVIAKQIRS